MTGLPDDTVSPTPFDAPDALATAGDDRDFLAELVDMFREQWPASMAEIRRAIADADATTLSRAAHTLRGSAASFGARPAMAATLAVETAAREGRLADAAAAAGALDAIMSDLDRALVAFTRTPA